MAAEDNYQSFPFTKLLQELVNVVSEKVRGLANSPDFKPADDAKTYIKLVWEDSLNQVLKEFFDNVVSTCTRKRRATTY